MRCSVCGNELKPDVTKCSVCGTSYKNTSSLNRAMSNISSLASALRAKREVVNNNKAFENDLKKVATREEEIEELYTKDINLSVSEDEYEDDFDLNAFYQEAKANEKKKMAEEDRIEESVKSEEIVDNSFVSNTLEEEPSIKDVEEDVEPEELTEEVVDETIDEPLDEKEEFDSTETIDEELNISQDDAGADKFEEDDDFINIDIDNYNDKDNNSVVTSGYIKESDIKTYDNVEESPSEEDFRIDQEPIEDTSAFVNLDSTTSQEEVKPEPVAVEQKVNISETEVEAKEENQQDGLGPVKAEDVPYTQLEENKNSKVSDDNPIIIDSKDVVGADAKNDEVSNQEQDTKSSKSSTKEKKPNKFCAVIARILLVLAVLTFAVVIAYKYLLQDLTDSNVVFDFIINFLNEVSNLHIVVVSTLGVSVLAILFSLVQLICVKKRKIGGITLLFSVIVAGGLAVGYYFLDMLMPAIDTVMGLLGI